MSCIYALNIMYVNLGCAESHLVPVNHRRDPVSSVTMLTPLICTSNAALLLTNQPQRPAIRRI